MNRRPSILGSLLCIALLSTVATSETDSIYLEPLPLMASPSYVELIAKSLVGTRQKKSQRIELFMIAEPFRQKEHALLIEKEYELDGLDGLGEITNVIWTLEYVLPKEKINPIACSSEEDLSKVEIDRHRIMISEEFGKIIENAWLSVVKLTRYWDRPYHVLDGTMYVFQCNGYFGHTVSPRSGPPKQLIELGLKLESFAMADENNRELIKKQCIELALEITNRRKSQPEP